MFDFWSVLAVPPLALIFLTAIFGLNEVRIRSWRDLRAGRGWVELLLGSAFTAMASMSFMLGAAVLYGASLYTWRGCLLMWSIAAVFLTFGAFAPWRHWFRRMAEA
ncbi:holin [Coralloluteibacterium thermophilus]|uniref:Holin n=1 Tax=Coralloluteibacterium thermophilum TaxID=2707049 RepID=A0ABV9NLA2_9GAMM